MPQQFTKATFQIENGPSYEGISFGAPQSAAGETVFTTSLVGYPESMTDPSYKGQILVFTQPLIGNYGVPSGEARDELNLLKYFESPNAHVVGIVVAEYAWKYSHWTAVQSLSEWCIKEGVAAITGVDTRSVVQYLREQGSSLGRIVVDDGQAAPAYIDTMKAHLVAQVSTKQPYYIAAGAGASANVALIDCGVKENIVRCLAARGANVTVFPHDYPIQDVALQFDGIFISNGPGDPKLCGATVDNLKHLLEEPQFEQLPIFGICMGHQLLALAAGATAVKMKYGNRAHNIPALDLTTGQCHITSQNHGYAIDVESLPKNSFKSYFVNLNDSSNEGLIHCTRPVFSTQFHPEAKGGPMDTAVLFDKYFNNIATYQKNRNSNAKTSIKFELPVQSMASERVF
ncbi:LANO_0G17194g1_1 [Lachancea nothofagi CBS 11611]|uniref:Carbamoyl phosphate synthase arginine-specific small chain n=1 Tax=Lachancea nothofagi CBS 11611 TaxID=1266666 RepID=A0A1G4KKG2_9SACH|nr:LANO_0G17194g1_1 [Lachancea nothofagi CBS 11611]